MNIRSGIFFLFLIYPAVLPGIRCEEQGQPEQKQGTIKGKVADLESRSPLAGVNITVLNNQRGTTTDKQGFFLLEKLPVENYVLQFDYMGYRQLIKTDIIVKPQRISFIYIYLEPVILDGETIKVSAGYFPAFQDQPTGTVNYSYEEIRRSPGSAGDVSRILAVLPGTAKVNDQSNSLIVRGGSPTENGFYIDNIEIPNINHYPDMGSSGGPIGLVNVDFIQEVNFYTGGFSVRYGDRLSSVMDITFREGNREEFDGQLDLNFAGFGFVGEGPVFNKKGSWLFSARRSFLDLLVDAIGTGVAPRYSDYQGKCVYDINPNNKVIIIGILGIDRITTDKKEAEEEGQFVYSDHRMNEGTFGMNWNTIWSKNGYSNTSIAYSVQQYKNEIYETKSDDHLLSNDSYESAFSLRNTNHIVFKKRHVLEFGLDTKYIINNYDYFYAEYTNALGEPVHELDNDFRLKSEKYALFTSILLQPLTGFKTNLGLRADYFTYNDKFHLSPRFSFSYLINTKTSLNGSIGIFYQYLPLILLSQKKEYKSLKTPHANHYILGITHLITEDTRLSLEIYQKDYQNFPVDPTQPSLFIIDELIYRYGFFFNHENLCDRGRAYTKGIEITLQKKLAKNFYGLVSGTLFKTKYKGYDHIWRDRVFDNRAIFSIEGGYKPNNQWEFSLRWIYAGGIPYTPFDQNASKTINRAVFDQNKINQARYHDYHSLNIRFDRRFHFTHSNLIFYFSVWNAYNRKNVSCYYWNEIENKQDKSYQWNSLPIFGIEFEF